MIRTKNVGKHYGEKAALSNISIEIPKHTLTTFIGANGAGKSTLLSIVSRLMKGEGEVLLDEKPLSTYKNRDLAKKMSILRQTNHISVRLTVRELIGFGRYPHSQSRLTTRDREIIQKSVDRMALEPLANAFIDQLSGGELQRALIAMVLAQDTEYILLDEPLNNLDMKHAVEIMRLLRKLVDEEGKTIVLVLHDLNFASGYSDHIVSLKDGRFLRQGNAQEIITTDSLREIYDMDIDIREIDGTRFCIYFK